MMVKIGAICVASSLRICGVILYYLVLLPCLDGSVALVRRSISPKVC